MYVSFYASISVFFKIYLCLFGRQREVFHPTSAVLITMALWYSLKSDIVISVENAIGILIEIALNL